MSYDDDRRRDDFYRDLDRRHENFRDDLRSDEKAKDRSRAEAREAMRQGDFLRALGRLDPDLGLFYANLSGTGGSTTKPSTQDGFQLATIQFFESGSDGSPSPPQTHFAKGTTRYVWTQVDIRNPFLVVDYRCELTIRYLDPEGHLMKEFEEMIRLARRERSRSYSVAMGWSTPGNWKPGTYRVEVWIDGQSRAQASFTIDALPFLDMDFFSRSGMNLARLLNGNQTWKSEGTKKSS